MKLYNLTPSARDPCVHSNVRERLWTVRHMDDHVIVGPPGQSEEVDRGHGPHHALERRTVPEAGHAASEVSGLDA